MRAIIVRYCLRKEVKGGAMVNSPFAEQPDHGHYTACANRMNEIDRISRRCTACTLINCAVMAILTLCGFRLSVISFIPGLIGEKGALGAIAVQLLIITAIAGVSIASVGRFKIGNVICFAIYSAMMICCIFSRTSDDVFTVFIGAAGFAFSFRAPSACMDYRQLSKTEGFPQFSERLAYQEEHSCFESDFANEYHETKSRGMDPAEPVSGAESGIGEDKINESTKNSGFMDEI